MKKIIDGKLYNTETADEIYSYDNGLGYTDFRECTETLYKTKKGNFFLHGEGGAMSRWATTDGNNSCRGSNILALTPREALDWIESRSIDVDDNDDIIRDLRARNLITEA